MTTSVNNNFFESLAKAGVLVDSRLETILRSSGLTMAVSDRWVEQSLSHVFDDVDQEIGNSTDGSNPK